MSFRHNIFSRSLPHSFSSKSANTGHAASIPLKEKQSGDEIDEGSYDNTAFIGVFLDVD